MRRSTHFRSTGRNLQSTCPTRSWCRPVVRSTPARNSFAASFNAKCAVSGNNPTVIISGLPAGIEKANGVRPAEAVFCPLNAHDGTAKFLDVTDRALVLFGQHLSPKVPGSCSLEFCFAGRHIRQKAYHAQLSLPGDSAH